ncbi:MAG: protoheme IX farnesyltransferase [Alphaproteobacteria bacterium]|nr:MAG: protoheme IX farnesyltransferase [Alphaproteobacteria bacterium]
MAILDVTTTRPASASDYVALLKPRVMSLVVFTGLVGYMVAPGQGDFILGFAAVLSIAVAAGAAGALNMWFDSDIDLVMSRTRSRPIPSGRVPRDEALMLGLMLSALSVVTMQLAANTFAALLLAFTIFFYAVIYTMWLKRLTPQNIVIGGLSGALPPAIAWAAKTGSLALDPILLVAIIFMWTPPHFWALALLQNKDYAAARVPMLPVTHGAKSTRRHIFAYTLLLAPLGVAPVLTGLGGPIYGAIAALGGAFFVFLAWRVLKSDAGNGVPAQDKPARDLFGFSIIYLFAVFAALLAERGFA